MKSSHPKRSGALATPYPGFKLGPVAASCVALLLSGGNVCAQQAQTAATNLDTVTVTGIRKGIEDAISVKKNSDSIVESVSAEDIGKLPDVSIAESIARLPGLAAQRVAGRAQVISVRGLSPDFATTLLNGREQVSTGDNRSVEFDQYPSELLSGVTVYKTPDAGLIGQGLSGTIDMQTVRPLSFGSRVVTLNARKENNSLGSIADAKSTGDRFSFSYIDQFADRTVGVALGYSHMATPILDIESDMFEWDANDRSSIGVPAGSASTHGAKAVSRGGSNVRDGLMGVIEFKPSKEWTSTLDLFTSKFKQQNDEFRLEFKMDALAQMSGGYPAGNYTSYAQNANKVQTGGAFSGIYPTVRGIYNSTEDTINAIGWANKFKLGGISLLADVSYSKAVRDEVNLETNTGIRSSGGGQLADNVNVNWANGSPAFAFGRSYSDPSKLILGGAIYDSVNSTTGQVGAGYGKLPHVEDELKGFKLVASLPIPGALETYFSGADAGLNYAARAKSYRRPQDTIYLAPGVGTNQTISSALQRSPVDLGLSGSGIIPAWNVQGVVAQYMTFNPTTEVDLWRAGHVWTVDEKIVTSFAKANIDTELGGGVSLRGNVGVQIQNTDQSSTSRVGDQIANQLKPFSDGKTYADILPSVNLAFLLPNDQTVRLGVAKQLARPRVDQLSSALNFSVGADHKPYGDGGNAQLDPWRANAYDISYEKYFGKKGYVAAAVFYKDLTSYIYKLTDDRHDFTNLLAGTTATQSWGSYTAPFNGQGGSLQGLELSASVPLNLLNKSLDGFGVTASASITNSGITVPQGKDSVIGAEIPLPGLSKNVSNLTAYYEKNGFSARVSQRKRSDFVGEITTYDGTRALKYVVGESIVDLQFGYNFTEGSLKGLGLLLQVNNLNDAAYQTYSGTPDKPLDYIKYGRTVMFGANYKF